MLRAYSISEKKDVACRWKYKNVSHISEKVRYDDESSYFNSML